MLRFVPLYAAVLALCACSSAPVVKFPSGSGTRQPINAASRPVAVPAVVSTAVASSAATTAAVQTSATAPARMARPGTPAEAPPEPVPLKVFMVNANERSMMEILRRWARVARVDFTWESDIDYPVTARMRAIHAGELETALEQMRAALAGVRAPLTIASTSDGLLVQGGAELPKEEATVAIPTKTDGVASALPADSAPPATPAVTTSAAVAPEAQARVPTPEPRNSWPIANEKTLREVLERWAALGGVKLTWESASDQVISDAARAQLYSGTFRESLVQLASNFGELKTPIGMKFLENGGLRVYDVEQPK